MLLSKERNSSSDEGLSSNFSGKKKKNDEQIGLEELFWQRFWPPNHDDRAVGNRLAVVEKKKKNCKYLKRQLFAPLIAWPPGSQFPMLRLQLLEAQLAPVMSTHNTSSNRDKPAQKLITRERRRCGLCWVIVISFSPSNFRTSLPRWRPNVYRNWVEISYRRHSGHKLKNGVLNARCLDGFTSPSGKGMP